MLHDEWNMATDFVVQCRTGTAASTFGSSGDGREKEGDEDSGEVHLESLIGDADG